MVLVIVQRRCLLTASMYPCCAGPRNCVDAKTIEMLERGGEEEIPSARLIEEAEIARRARYCTVVKCNFALREESHKHERGVGNSGLNGRTGRHLRGDDSFRPAQIKYRGKPCEGVVKEFL